MRRRRPPPRPEVPALPELLSSSNARLAAARRLTRPRARREAGLFLAEGAQAVREAVAAGAVRELFVTPAAARRHPDLAADLQLVGCLLGPVAVSYLSDKDAAALSETVTPQGLIAVCADPTVPAGTALTPAPRLAAALVGAADPGNVGTVIRTADAAGAGAVCLLGGADVLGGKVVRSTAGSLFHLRVGVGDDPAALLAAAARAGLAVLATTGRDDAGPVDDLDGLLDAGVLAGPVLWLFGSEAHGLPADLLAAADRRVRVPIRGRAESLNLAAAAAVCLYASAYAQR